MRKLRDLLQKDKGGFKFVYGCAPHALHNYVKDICAIDGVSCVLKQAMVVVKAVRQVNLLRKLYETLCKSMTNTIVLPILFSSTRWGGALQMLHRLDELRVVLCALPAYVASQHEIDYELEPSLVATLSDRRFWVSVAMLSAFLSPIANALAYLEADATPISSVYATFIYIKMHIASWPAKNWLHFGWNKLDAKTHLNNRLLYQYERISSPVHALAFRCDPVFDGMRTRVETKFNSSFLDLGTKDLLSNCREAIALLLREATAKKP